MATRLVDSQGHLALFAYTDAVTFPTLCENGRDVMRLWRSACIEHGPQHRAIYRIPYETNANRPAQSARAPSLGAPGLARKPKRGRLARDVPDSFDRSGPAEKSLLLASGGNTPESIHRFLATGAAINAPRQAELSLPAIASGIQRWMAYWDLVIRPY